MTGFDPLVADALERIAANVQSNPDELLRRAAAATPRVAAARARRARWALVVVVAVLALVAGGALAASHFDLLPWLRTKDRSEATYAVDRNRRYRGPTPEALICPGAGPGQFICSDATLVRPSGRRYYEFSDRIEWTPLLTRQIIRRGIDAYEKTGRLTADAARRFRNDLDAVGDDYLRALNFLFTIETRGSSEPVPGHPDLELVPPRGVPLWIVCNKSVSGGLRCHDLAGAVGVPVGAPVYLLHRGPDWVAVPHARPQQHFGRLLEAVLGRKPTTAEIRFLEDLTFSGSGSGSSELDGMPGSAQR
jgi:hypothetical protein